MVPGPVPVAPEVAAAAGAGPVDHHSDEFRLTLDETRRALADLLNCDGSVEIMPGGGRLGIESALKSLFEPGDPIFVCVTGTFGEWLATIAERCGADVITERWQPGRVVNPEVVAACLAKGTPRGSQFSAVAVAHCETSTGTVNPLDDIGRLCRDAEALFVVDAVSTVGVLPVDMAHDHIDVCVTASQKGLGALMGLSVVALGTRALARLSARASLPATFGLDLSRWRADPDSPTTAYPVVPSPSLVMALREAVRPLESGGLAATYQRHEDTAAAVRSAFRRSGLDVFGDSPSCGLTTVEVPTSVSAHQVQERVLACHGIRVATGMGPIADRIIRLSHMGIQADPGRVDVAVRAIVEECRNLETGLSAGEVSSGRSASC
jgi:aspartate aminotransferase-like enzyme